MSEALETRVLFRHIDEPGLHSIETYERLGGYAALKHAFRESEPGDLVSELEDSGLRGRGGAGFSMGKKASFLPQGDMDKYLCCNADESEPGTFKDRELMFKNPHGLVEGVAIGAMAAGATRAFIFIRGEYAEVADRLDAAVAEAYEAGYLGDDILGTGVSVSVVVHRGAGAYICGEETALLDSLEGKRGNPRLKPPFPAIQGLYGGPTLINNVETLMNLPNVVNNGSDWFKGFGTEQSTGTKVVSVSGCVRRPGNYEIELGIPSRDIIYGLAGGPPEGREVKAWYPGGSSAPGPRARGARRPLLLRGARRGRLDARLRRDHRRRRHRLDPGDGAADRALLPPRVLRQVQPLPGGNQLDGEDARAGRPRRGDPDGPRHHRLGPGEHHRQLPLRPRRRDGDAGRLDGPALARRVRGDDRPRPRGRGRSARRRARRDDARRGRRVSPAGKAAHSITIVVDGVEIAANEGAMLVDAAKHGDVEIPVFCYEPKLGDPVGACRMCLVEIEGIPKLQTACSTPVRDGMVVYTQTDRVKEAQNAVVEFLLVNHPLDCPVCDKGGECPLQDIAMGWGAGKSRVTDPKRHFQKPIPLSPLIRIDRERCILCYRCVRFSQEVSEDEQLQLLERGAKTFVGTHEDRPYIGPFHGNIIELCPVGALTSQSYRFRARPWDIEDAGSVCTLCPSQCNVKFTVRDEKVVRVLARDNDEVDDGWLCDKGRFGYQMFSSPDRPLTPQLRSGGGLEPASWDQAIEKAARGLAPAIGRTAAIVGGSTSNEEGWLIQRLVRGALGSDDVTSTARPGLSRTARNRLAAPELAVGTADIDHAGAILVLGCDPMHEMPIVELRIRKAVRRNGAKLLVATERPTALDGGGAIDSSGCLEARRYAPGAARGFIESLRSAIGSGDDEADAAGFADALRDAGPVVIVWGEGMLAGDDREQVAESLLGLADVLGLDGMEGGGLYEVPGSTNGRGLREVGCAEDFGPGLAATERGRSADEIRAALESGEIEALILGDVDPVRDFDDPEGWKRALSAAKFTLSISMFAGASAQASDVHLPAESHAEKEGTVTHPDGRLQRVRPSVPRPGSGAADLAGAQRALGPPRRRPGRRNRERGLRPARRRGAVLRRHRRRRHRRHRRALAGVERCRGAGGTPHCLPPETSGRREAGSTARLLRAFRGRGPDRLLRRR